MFDYKCMKGFDKRTLEHRSSSINPLSILSYLVEGETVVNIHGAG